MSGERFSSPQASTPTESELIDRELSIYEELEDGTINNATARAIAGQLLDEDWTALKTFVTTGYIRDDLLIEIDRKYTEHVADQTMSRRVGHLSMYVATRMAEVGGTRPVDGWADLQLREASDDLCVCCFEHISRNHRVGCPLGVDDEEQLDRVIELGKEHGPSILAYLDYRGFRTMDELAQVVKDYQAAYYGTFANIDTLRQHYDIGPAEYIEQTYYIVEGLHGDIYVFDR